MKKLTMSKATLLPHCRYWLRDDGPEWQVDEPGYPALVGTTVGKMAELYATFPGAEDIELETDRMASPPYIQRRTLKLWAQLRRWLDKNHTPNWEPEIAYSLDPVTLQGSRLGFVGDRKYPNTNNINGTVDVVNEAIGSIRDYKCTHQAPWPRYWPQLGMLALAAFGDEAKAIELVHVTELGVNSMVMPLTPAKMQSVRKRVRAHLDGVPDSEAMPGEHCAKLYCPARFTCPQSTAKKTEREKQNETRSPAVQ
jgi:hypothetical protein